MARKQTSLPQKAGRPKTAKQEAMDYVQQVDEDEAQNGVTHLVTSNENTKTDPTSVPESRVTNLVTSDQTDLERLEKIIDDGIKTFFYDVGQALGEIREKQLYKIQGYDRYEDYCAERWNMSRIHAFRLENAAIVIDNLKNRVTNLVTFAPLTESQIRPLTKLEPEQQQQVWEKVIEAAPVVQDKPKVTAKLVEEVVAQITNKPEDKTEQQESKQQESSDKKFTYRLSLDEELHDSLNESFYKIRKLVGKENKNKVTKEWLAEIMLSVALQELEEKGDKSSMISRILKEIVNDVT